MKNRAIKFTLSVWPFMLNVALIDFLIPLKYDAVLNNLPLMGLLITAAWVGSSFLDFAVGDLTDRVGVAKTIQIGVILSVIGSALFGLFQNFVVMTLGIFIWGISYIMLSVPSEAYILSFPRKSVGNAYGWMYFFFDAAYAVAPLLCLLIITYFGISYAIFAAALVALLSLSVAARGKQNQNIKSACRDILYRDGIIKKEWLDIKKMNFKEISLLVNMFVCGFWFMSIMIGAPLLFFHGSGNVKMGAILTFFFMLPFACMELFYGRNANSHNTRAKMAKFGFIAASALLFLFYFTSNYYSLLVIAFLTTVFANMAWVASEVSICEFLPNGRKGEFAGIFTAAKDIGFDIAPVFYGISAYFGLKVPFLVLAFVFLGAFALFFAANRR